MKLKGKKIDDDDTIKINTTRELQQLLMCRLPAIFPEVTETLGQEHIISRGLL
jgi:hypothetical protein